MKPPSLPKQTVEFSLLIVEDDPEYGKWLQCALEHSIFRSVAAESLHDAREKLKTFTPDLILIDEKLPDGSGLDLCQEIRVAHRVRKIILAVLTGKQRIWSGDAWFQAGADACWPKTPNAARLIALIKGLVRRREWDTKIVKPLIPGLLMDPKEWTLSYYGLPSKPLNKREIIFLDLLFNAYPDILPREKIQEKVFIYSRAENFDLALNELLRRVKKKLPSLLSDGIEAVYRRGYRLKIPSEHLHPIQWLYK